ncbi:hypothetical protein [Paucibacter sp. Y2R2-4]|uniref:hypothetical protein n=1 Tax=Paucibacter sp. Y2R2-4 TaxID=2893553 RepID=UPI0021E3F64E|nr:hypothetical protein [Paucibacter sp. Y2R2-4]MCV2349301.1 hypothetical protein [Paucibacter sp. Y2R2-4]
MGYWKELAGTAKTAGADLLRQALAPLYSRPAGERGSRTPADVAMQRFYRQFAVSTEVREKIVMLREMEVRDGRVKRIHGRVARDTIRGGLLMQFQESSSAETLRREWMDFAERLQLTRVQKLRSDARGLVSEGNLPLQLVLDERQRVVAAVRMPAETIVPIVDANGRFKDPTRAYEQRDVLTGEVLATFAAYQLQMARFDPLNYDDMGEMGRPMLDSVAETWRKLVMTEEDMVIRRRQRAPMRLSHVLEGATTEDLEIYRKNVEGEKGEITTDFYSNRRGAVSPVQGDANLDQIADVVHLLDSFFAGTPLPKGLMGYTEGLSRDILEDLKRDYYDEIDSLQDTLAWEYESIFRIHLLLKGIVAGPEEFSLRFSERRTETPNQIADMGLKLQALGLPPPMVWAEIGRDPVQVAAAADEWAQRSNPYPGDAPTLEGGQPGMPPVGGGAGSAAPQGGARVSITPGNAPKGGSATSIGVKGSNGGRGRGG